jgi:hypothetical protein
MTHMVMAVAVEPTTSHCRKIIYEIGGGGEFRIWLPFGMTHTMEKEHEIMKLLWDFYEGS